MRLLGWAMVLLALAGACSPYQPTPPTPSPYPATTFRVDFSTNNSIFAMTPGQTILGPEGITSDAVLAVVSRYPGATVLAARAPGRRHLFSPPPIARCGGGRDC